MEWRASGLEGISVVDAGRDVATAFCAHRLAALGADVASTRTVDDPAVAAYSRGTRRVAPGPALQHALAGVDVLVDDDGPDAAAIADALPASAVRVVLTGFGREGPYAGFRATDLVAEAFGGALVSCGRADRAPVALGGRLLSTYLGAIGAAAAAAELRLAQATGEGSVVDVTWVDALAASMDRRAVQLLGCAYTGWDAEREDGSTPQLVTGVFPCADGWVYVSLYGWHIRSVCELIGDDDLAPFRERPGLALRPPDQATFRAAVLGWLAARPWEDAVAEAQAIGWPVTPARTLAGALDDRWLADAGLVEPAGDVRVPATGIAIAIADAGAP